MLVFCLGIFLNDGMTQALRTVETLDVANVAVLQSRQFTRVCGEAKEGAAPLVLKCSRDQIIKRIDFASFGTPLAKTAEHGVPHCEGAFSVSASCNADMSMEVVQQACIGKHMCTIAASAELFGNPCEDVKKSVAVKATCGDGDVASFDYAGCFTHDDRAEFSTFLDAPVTWAKCNAEATSRGAHFFVLESPHGNTGKAKCGFGGDYTGFMKSGAKDFSGSTSVSDLRVDDKVCGKRVDADGHPLGALFKMAVYAVAEQVRGKQDFGHAWAIDDEAGWDVCLPACGTSSMARQVVCLRSDGNVVEDAFCPTDERPAATLPCENFDQCSYGWHEGGFSECGPGCGSSTRRQSVVCWRRERDEGVADALCSKQQKPASRLECVDYSLCVYDWVALADFAGCDATCGSGTEARRVECRRSISGDRGEEDVDMSVEMFLPPSAVSQMQEGQATANVTLDVVPHFNCLEANKLEATEECWDFDGCQFEWIAYDWSECTAACGSVAVQTRQVECMRGRPEGTGMAGDDGANTWWTIPSARAACPRSRSIARTSAIAPTAGRRANGPIARAAAAVTRSGARTCACARTGR